MITLSPKSKWIYTIKERKNPYRKGVFEKKRELILFEKLGIHLKSKKN
jgi:hypothetical protein